MSSAPSWRAAVIGCGRIGAQESLYAKGMRPGTHAGMFYGNKRIQSLALVDSSPLQLKKAGRAFPRARLFEDTERMMKEVRPHIVSVVVPTQAHEAVVKKVVRHRPLAVICEKPLASAMPSARRIVALCKANKVLLFVNHNRRFDRELLKVKEEIKTIGPLVQGNVQYTRGIFNNGTHAVDLLRLYLGEVQSVVAFRNRQTEDWKDLKNDLNVDGMLFFESGARVALQSLRAKDYYIFDISLYGRKGRILITQRGLRIEYQLARTSSALKGRRELQYENSRVAGGMRSMMKGVLAHVMDCLDGKANPLSTGRDGIAAMRVLEALQKSAALQGKLMKI